MNLFDSNRTYTVSELNSIIKNVLDSMPFLQTVCVTGEVSNYAFYSSGHHYFSLKDRDASIKCVLFKSYAQRVKFSIKNGVQVRAYGRISVYPRDGVFQLYVNDILDDGAGDIYRAFEALKARLDAEGLFSDSHKKKLPAFPDRIAVVTSPDGAAVHDIIRVLRNRWPLSEVLVLPVKVQGEGAAGEISSAIDYANLHSLADLLIIGRGGGPAEDLWAFSEEIVCRSVYASNIPVISGIGHEPDIALSDYVSDVRAATPSNAAQLAVPDMDEMRQHLDRMYGGLCTLIQNRISHDTIALQKIQNSNSFLEFAARIAIIKAEISNCALLLNTYINKIINNDKQIISSSAAALDAMSPMRLLSKGYAFITDAEEKTITNVAGLNKDDSISAVFCDGKAICRVESIIPLSCLGEDDE